MTQANDERAARKEYIRRRQKTVFSIVGAVMVVAMVVSLLFFFHVGGLGNVKSAAVQPNYGQQAPCPIKEADATRPSMWRIATSRCVCSTARSSPASPRR